MSSPAATNGASPTTSSSGHGISIVAKVHVGGQPCGVVYAAGAVWVSDADRSRLLRIDPLSGTVRQTDTLDPTPCEIATGFGSIWVVTQSGKLDRVDPRTGRVTVHIKVGATSYEAVAAAGAMWVSNRNDGTVDRVDPVTNRVTRTLHLPGAPGGIAYELGALWVGDDTSGAHHFFRIDPRTGHVTRIAAGDRPGYVAVTPERIWASGVDDSTVTEIDARSSHRIRTIHVGISPVNLVGRSTDVWVPEDIGNEVVRIDANTGRIVGRISAGEGGPAVVAPGDGDIWVTMFESGDVWRLRASM